MPEGWIDVSRLRNFLLEEPLLDWFDLYGEANGFVPDTAGELYLPEADYGLFVREKAHQFESCVLDLIRQKATVAEVGGARSNDDAFYEQTMRLMREGVDAIYQGLVRDAGLQLFGVPDLIVKGSLLEALVPGTLDSEHPDDYFILDMKYTGLDINKKGDLGAKHKWERFQIALYERALAQMVGRTPGRSFVLGRRLSGAAGAGGGCFDRLGWVKPLDDTGIQRVQEALAWRRDLARDGHAWKPSLAGDPRLAPRMKNEQDAPWHESKKALVEARSAGAVLPSGPIQPERIESRREIWFRKPPVEFFVDFETLNGMNDDFSRLPLAGGSPMIFMIGCGHEEAGEFQFNVWSLEAETYAEEARIIQAWRDHMDSVLARLDPEGAEPLVHHWFRHEPTELQAAADRHGRDEWARVQWFDLLENVMKAEPVQIPGVNGLSLKPVTRKLYELNHVRTIWPTGAVEGGLSAMTAAWACYRLAREGGMPAREVKVGNDLALLPAIEAYNEVDCKAMWEILAYLRRAH